MSYGELRAECARERIGPLLWSLLLEVTRRVARRYPPDLYNDGISWGDESFSDLAQEVALTRLLEERQLEYVLDTADQSSGDRYEVLAKLLAFQVRRVLSHRRRTTVVDRLQSRIRTLVASPPFRTTNTAGDTLVDLEGAIGPDEAAHPTTLLTDTQIRGAAYLIGSIPRIPSRVSAERESKVYTAAHLEELVATVVNSFGPVVFSDFRRILDVALTAWVPTFLRGDEEDRASSATPELELERTQMHTLVATFVADLEPIHRSVLLGKSQGMADGELAQRAGRSRPWLADRKAEVLARVQSDVIEQLPDGLHDDAFRHMLDECTVLEEVDP